MVYSLPFLRQRQTKTEELMAGSDEKTQSDPAVTSSFVVRKNGREFGYESNDADGSELSKPELVVSSAKVN